jgi:pSer/pThr/pTyr-binding forkhead associated (FHA) protein
VISLLPHHDRSISHQAIEAPDIPTISNGYALRIMQGEEYGKVYRLNDIMKSYNRRILTMGRDDVDIHNSIPIKETESSYVSRKHCTLEFNPLTSTWTLRDGQWDQHSNCKWKTSTNGTFVDSREISTNGIKLNLGEIISIGDVKLRVEGY